MTNISEFKNMVAVDVMPCPDPLINREVIAALIEFCTRAQVLKRMFNHVFISAAIDTTLVDSYEIGIDEYVQGSYRASAITKLYIDGTDWEVRRKTVLTTIPDWDNIKEASIKYYDFTNNTTITLHEMETTVTNLTLEIALTPLRSATSVDDMLYEEWADPITAKAKSRLLSMPNKDWTDPVMGSHFEREWKRGLTRASALVGAEGTNRSVGVKWVEFGGTR